MGPRTVRLVLVSIALTATLLESAIVYAGGSSGTTTSKMARTDTQFSPLQRRQDLLENRMNERETSVNTRLNEYGSRLNRIDHRFDGIEKSMSDMKDYLQLRMEAMEKKVELALAGIKPQQDGCQGEKQVSYLLPLVRGDFRPLRAPEVHKGCEEALRDGWTTSGIYRITPDQNTSFDVFCEQQLDGGGWTVFQARKDGSVNFYRDWNTYKQGFGELTGEFWLGNTKIHLLTKHRDQQLMIELISPEGDLKYVVYSLFLIEDELLKFRLNITGYSGGSPPGDSLSSHNGKSFSTYDQDNDLQTSGSCALNYMGGWWYGGCHASNLNGLYGSTDYGKGLSWKHWRGYHVSMNATRMMIRKRP